MSNQTFVPNLGGRPATLREALEDCYNADRLREFARALNIDGPTRKAGLPAGARAFLEDMAHRAAMLSITSRALLIECADSEVGQELARDRRTKRLCTVTADGSVIVVPSESEAAFRRAVRERGYPLLAGGDR